MYRPLDRTPTTLNDALEKPLYVECTFCKGTGKWNQLDWAEGRPEQTVLNPGESQRERYEEICPCCHSTGKVLLGQEELTDMVELLRQQLMKTPPSR